MRGGVRWFPRCRRALCVWRKGRPAQPFRSQVTSEHGFSDAVEITLSSLPKGVSTNPASPFSVSPGQPVAVLFGADSGAATGQFAISAQATSGVLRMPPAFR
jgi:hypothetical protein